MLAAVLVGQLLGEPVVLYDGEQRSLPEKQGWIYHLTPPLRNQARQLVNTADRAVNLNTSRNIADRAGYFIRFPQRDTHPQAPETFDRQHCYRVGFALKLLSEHHTAAHQAGFSLIALSHDLAGIELGFRTDEIFAQSADLARAEENRELPFRINTEYTDFALEIKEDAYTLSANGQEILAGPLRDYSNAGEPYTIPNLLFIGDNSETAAASANLRSLWIDTKLSDTPPPVDPGTPPPVQPPIADKPAVFTVSEAESALALAGIALGIAIKPQGEGSLNATYSGEIHAILADGKILFQPASRLDAIPSGKWEPQAGGKNGSAPADYGGAVPDNPFGNTVSALRNIEFILASDWIDRQAGSAEFPATNLVVSIPEDANGALDILTRSLIPIRIAVPLDSVSSVNNSKTPATLAVQDNIQTLTLPIQIDIFARIIRDNDLKLTFSGQIVARRNLPEPTAPPALAIQLLPAGEVQLSWNALPGRIYQVQQSANLDEWEAAGTPVIAEAETAIWKTADTEADRYYRLILQVASGN